MRTEEEQAQYTIIAKVLHWLIAGILVLQFTVGWIMPSIRRGMEPGLAMHVHISTGIVVLGLIVVRFLWRITHPVPPEPELPLWQRNASATVHWPLYLLVLATTLQGNRRDTPEHRLDPARADRHPRARRAHACLRVPRPGDATHALRRAARRQRLAPQ